MSVAQKRVRSYLITAWIALMASSAVCMLIRSDLFDHPDYGISFYGSIRATLVPYVLGLLIVVYCLWRVAKELQPYQRARPLRIGYLLAAACLLGIILTPMALHPIVWWAHIVISAVLLMVMTWVVVWVLCQKEASWIDYGLGVVFLLSGIAIILSSSWVRILGVYAIAELVVFTAIILLFGRAARRIVHQP